MGHLWRSALFHCLLAVYIVAMYQNALLGAFIWDDRAAIVSFFDS
jgi:hypothetical protein